jgi:G3E family GTPase
VPITIITGFLGSGKTTLVNRILRGDHGKRVVVIENELGAISLDHELIDTQRQSDAPVGVYILKNGCMCCSGESPGSELERVLDKLLDMTKVEGGSLPFDYVLIETSGLADPAPIAQVLWRHEMGDTPFFLDGIVSLVDAKHVLRHLRPTAPFAFARRRPEVEKQIAMSDRVVLNKADLAGEAELRAVEAAVEAVNRSATLMRASHADVPLGVLLDNEAYSNAQWLARKQQLLDPAAGEAAATHGAAVSCVCVGCTNDVVLPRLQAWLQARRPLPRPHAARFHMSRLPPPTFSAARRARGRRSWCTRGTRTCTGSKP